VGEAEAGEDMTTHILIGCSASKRGNPCAAAELYTGEVFRLSLRWARLHGGRVWILSALHGLVPADRELAPYDATLSTSAKRDAWTKRVTDEVLDATGDDDLIVALAGAAYCGWRDAAVEAGRWVCQPLQHLGIGRRKQRLATEIAIMDRPWWDPDQRDLNANVLGSSRVIDIMRESMERAPTDTARAKAQREVDHAERSHRKLVELYASLRQSEKPKPAPAVQGDLWGARCS
jgi:hypothetical protein